MTEQKENKKDLFETEKKILIEKYGKENLRILELPLDKYGKNFLEVIAKIPDRKIITQFMNWADKSLEKAQNILVANCLLTHNEQVMKDDSLFFACVNGISSLIEIREAKIKNL